MKRYPLILTSGILFALMYFLFLAFETEILRVLTPYFPLQKHYHPIGYFIDLVRLIASETLWLSIFLFIWWYLLQRSDQTIFHNNLNVTFLKRPSQLVATCIAVFIVITISVAVFILEQFPNSADEYAYIFQAETFSKGKLCYIAPEVSDFFTFNHITQKDGLWISRFPPGWPLLLSLAFILHVPLITVNLIIGAITLWVFYIFAKRNYGEAVALWSLLALALTSFYIFNAASFFSHTSSLLQTLLFIHFFYIYINKKQRIEYALLSGFFLGLLIINRYYTALLVFAPFFIYAVMHFKLATVRLFVFMAIGALPSLIFLLWYNYMITGNPLLPVTMWAYDDEALGFVNGHTLLRALDYTLRRLGMFLYWASPSLLVLYFVLLAKKIVNKDEWKTRPEDYLFLFLIIGYIFYYQTGGNQYGPRFYFEGLPFLIVFVINKVYRARQRWAIALLVAGVIYSFVKIPFIAAREHQIIKERTDVYALVKKQNVHHAVVFISDFTGIIRPMSVADLTRNDEKLKNDVLYAIDLDGKNSALIHKFKDRNFYLYSRPEDSPYGKLEKIDRKLVSNTD